jgi:hypothetical protein
MGAKPMADAPTSKAMTAVRGKLFVGWVMVCVVMVVSKKGNWVIGNS